MKFDVGQIVICGRKKNTQNLEKIPKTHTQMISSHWNENNFNGISELAIVKWHDGQNLLFEILKKE